MVDVTYQDVRDTYGAPAAVADADLFPVQQSIGTRVITGSELFTYIDGQTFTSPVLKRYSETTAAATSAIDRANGGRQTLTLTADVTLTIAMNNGEDMELTILNGDTWTVTWPAGDWLGGSLPVLGAKTRVIVDKDSTGTLNFSLVGDYS